MTIDTCRSTELPTGWIWTKLGDLAHPSKEKVDPRQGPPVRYIGLEHIQRDTGSLLGYGYSDEVRSAKSAFRRGDLLYGKLRPYLNKVHLAEFDGVCSTDILVFPGNPHVVNKYLLYRFLSSDFVRFANLNVSGVQHPRTNFSTLSSFRIALAPLEEQHRIVDEIETQFTRLDAAVAALQRAQAKLARYKASVLKAACEGRLVATEAELARQEGRDYEPAEVLLQRILAQRRARWEEEHPGKPYQEPARPDTTNLPDLPAGWVWARVAQMVEVSTGATPKRGRSQYYDGGDIPWVKSEAVNQPFVDRADEFITQRALNETSAKVFPVGTLLVAMYGEGKTRGKASELRIRAATNQALAALVCDGGSEESRPFIKVFLQKNYEDVRRLSSGGVQPNLNLGIIRAICIPLAPAVEQRRIVNEVERRLSVAQVLEAAMEANLRRAERLRQAILKRAFEGRLVPQDPNDEPASALLARIRAGRAAQPAGVPRKEVARPSRQKRLPTL